MTRNTAKLHASRNNMFSSTTTKGSPFVLVTAFTNDPFAGNPAAAIFLDHLLPDETLGKIAQNLHQPVTSFILPSSAVSANAQTANFDIRWFTGGGGELPICGHGTVAAAKAVFTIPGLLDGSQVQVVEFKAPDGRVMRASRVIEDDEEWFEILFPAAEIDPLNSQEEAKVADIIARATGRDPEDVKIVFAGSGAGDFCDWLMVELMENVGLSGISFDTQIFVSALPDMGKVSYERWSSSRLVTT